MADNRTNHEGIFNVVPGTVIEKDRVFDVRDEK